MGMETLNSAARAAGFAMAASDEPYEQAARIKIETVQWRPAEPLLLAPTGPRANRTSDWRTVFWSMLGRRAPASPA